MVFERIEQLKRDYTDKFVVVDERRPELKRFRGLTGTVRTVNMSGRALVEFEGNNNIGWFDIELDYLKVIDQPLPKATEKAKKPADKAPAAKAETPPKADKKATPAAKPAAAPAAGGGMSVAEMLAAARGEKGGAAKAVPATPKSAPAAKAAAAPADPKKMSVADMLAAARSEKGGAAPGATAAAPTNTAAQLEAAREKPAATPVAKAAPAPAAVDPKKMTVAEMLAAARGEKGGAAAPAPAAKKAPPPEEPAAVEETATPEPVVSKPAVESSEAPSAGGHPGTMKDKITAIPEMIAYCRKVDAKK